MSGAPDSPIGWLQAQAGDAPDTPAIRDARGTLSYGALWHALGNWHREFEREGLTPGRIAAVLTSDRSRLVRAVWLALYSGCPVMPLDPQRPATHGLINELGVEQVFTDPGVMPPGGRARRLPVERLDEMPEGTPSPPSPAAASEPQLLITTSGTEGAAKAVMLSGAGLMASAEASCRLFDLGRGDTWLCSLPVIHVGGLMILLRCACAGATVELDERFDPAAVWDSLCGGATHTSLSPVMLNCIMDAADDAPVPANLRHVLTGGSAMPPGIARRAAAMNWPVTETYGMSETATHIAIVEPESRALRPIDGGQVDLAGGGMETDTVAPVRLAGPMLMLGYANADLRPGDGLDEAGGLVSTDLGRRSEDGHIRIVGRRDDVIICGGLNIHPVEVEQLLAGCPGLTEAAVTSQPDPVWGQQLVVLYTGDDDPEGVAAWAAANLPGRFRPRIIRRLDSLPKNPLGKLQRDRLPALAAGQ